MRAWWAAAFLWCGCGLVSGLDGLGVDDGGVDAQCMDCVDAREEEAIGDASDAGDADARDSGDADADGDAAPPSVVCGNKECSGNTPVCCLKGSATATCVANASDCGNGGVAVACDSPDDCPPNSTCCAVVDAGVSCDIATSVSCVVGICGFFDVQMCGGDAACPKPEMCKVSTCTLPGYDICSN